MQRQKEGGKKRWEDEKLFDKSAASVTCFQSDPFFSGAPARRNLEDLSRNILRTPLSVSSNAVASFAAY